MCCSLVFVKIWKKWYNNVSRSKASVFRSCEARVARSACGRHDELLHNAWLSAHGIWVNSAEKAGWTGPCKQTRKSMYNAPLAAGHNTGINLLLSTSAWVLLRHTIERRETRPTA